MPIWNDLTTCKSLFPGTLGRPGIHRARRLRKDRQKQNVVDGWGTRKSASAKLPQSRSKEALHGSRCGTGHRCRKGIRFKRNTSDVIPVIDFSPMLSSKPEKRREIAPEIRKACMEVGFFYLKNHGIPDAVTRRAHQAMRRYFALPREEKLKQHYLTTPNHRGYVALGDIKADHELRGEDMHEAFESRDDLPTDDPDYLKGVKFYGPNAWPDQPPDFRWALGTYFDTQLEFGKVMLRAFALALQLPEIYFDEIYTKPLSRLRTCYYPPQRPDWDIRKIGIGAHRDYEIFTTVWQSPAARSASQRRRRRLDRSYSDRGNLRH